MAMTNGKEAIDEEIRRRKRVNNDKDACPAKKAKVEGSKAMELPIRVGDKAEGEAAVLCDGELNKLRTSTDDKTKEEEAALSDDGLNKLRTHTDDNAENGDEVNRLRGLLVYDPKKLSNKDVKNVIRYLEIDEIVSLALKSGQGKGSDDDGDTGFDDDGDTVEEWIDEDDPYVPNSGKQFGILRLMLRRIEKVKEAHFSLLYENLPRLDFAPLLLIALDSYSNRCCGGVPLLTVEDRDMIPQLCRVLPWKLFAHILSYKTSLTLLKSTCEETREETGEETSEETIEECTPAQKEAAESCEICFGKGRHFGIKGGHCSYLDYIPNGVTVGPNCWIVCRDCGRKNYNPFKHCFWCDSDAGRVVVIPSCLKYGPFLHGF